MKLSHGLMLALGLCVALAACSGGGSAPSGPNCQAARPNAPQLLYPIPGTTAVPDNVGILIYEGYPGPNTITLFNGGLPPVATTATSLPSPLPTPFATPSSSGTMYAVTFPTLASGVIFQTQYALGGLSSRRSSAISRHSKMPKDEVRLGASRSRFLAGVAAAAASAGTPLPAFAKGQDYELREVVSRPLDLETQIKDMRPYLTPNEAFFVSSHFGAPSDMPAPGDYRLKIEGEVDKPLSLSLRDLRGMRQRSVVAVLQCAGNGRAFFRPQVPGVQWQWGAVGNARWTGVSVSDVLSRVGVRPLAAHLGLVAADRAPVDATPRFNRSIPFDKALDPDTILAYEMNGEALPAAARRSAATHRSGLDRRKLGEVANRADAAGRRVTRVLDGYRVPLSRRTRSGRANPYRSTRPIASRSFRSRRSSRNRCKAK